MTRDHGTTGSTLRRRVLWCARVFLVWVFTFLSVVFLGSSSSYASSTPLWNGGSYTVTPWPSLDGTQKVVNHTITRGGGNMTSASTSMYCRSTPLTSGERADISDDGVATLTGTTTVSYGSFHLVTTYTTTYAGAGCTAPAVPIAYRVTASEGRIWYEPGPAVEPPSSCSDFLVDEQAGYVAGELSVRWRVKASTNIPGAGWRVYAASTIDGETGDLIGTVSTTAIPGFTGWYGDDFVTDDTAFARVYRGNSDTCYVTLAVPDSPVDIDPPGTGEDGDGSDCGLNPFCYTKAALVWVFVPDDAAFAELEASWASASEVLPFSLFVTAWDAAEELTPGQSGCGDAYWGVNDTNFANACWPDWEIEGADVMDRNSDGMEWWWDNRGAVETVLWITVLAPLCIGLAWHFLPFVGDSGKSA